MAAGAKHAPAAAHTTVRLASGPLGTTMHDVYAGCPLCLQDDHVGTAVLDLGQLDPAAMSYLELPLIFEKSKHAAAGGQARLVLSVKGWISSFGTLLADTQHIPGAVGHIRDGVHVGF